MWENDWSDKFQARKLKTLPNKMSKVKADAIDYVYLLSWREHCVECAPPECYQVCPLYVERDDQKCARFRYGIARNFLFEGHFDYGADIYFRRWGKLESNLKYGLISLTTSKRLSRMDQFLLSVINPIARLIKPINSKRYLNGGYKLFRHKALQVITRKSCKKKEDIDDLLVEAWNPSEKEFSIIMECHQDILTFRTVLKMKPGNNLHIIPFQDMNLNLNSRFGQISLMPENDAEVRIIFTWLDFIKRNSEIVTKTESSDATTKVKCVVWDLDNTLWKGILVEDGPEGIFPHNDAIQLIYELDKRGIIQSIASKNDYKLAWKKIEEFRLDEYFICPAINWDPKSENIKQIAKELNIGLDTFALIDDSGFERGEVSHQIPHIRTYSDESIATLLERPEFNVPVTDASRQRRKSYLAETKRKRIAKSYGENYEKFLETCQMTATLFKANESKSINRCLELLQRSNQLNLSTYRYEKKEFLQLLNNSEILCVATNCKDRFGNYGTIGFASISFSGEIPLILDYVISCRVAKKKLENAWFSWLINNLRKDGFQRVHAQFIPTERNGELRSVLDEVGFVKIDQVDNHQLLELIFTKTPPAANVVTIFDKGIGQTPKRIDAYNT